MNWAAGIWVVYTVLTLVTLALSWWGINKIQKVLLSGSSDENE